MNVRKQHVGKSHLDRQRYQEYIAKVGSSPTLDEKLSFKNTTEQGEDFSNSLSSKSRPFDLKKEIIEHFRKHWLGWVLTCAIGIGSFLVVGVKFDLFGLNYIIQEQGRNINTIQSDIKSIIQKNNDQDIRIQESNGRVDILNQRFNDFKERKR